MKSTVIASAFLVVSGCQGAKPETQPQAVTPAVTSSPSAAATMRSNWGRDSAVGGTAIVALTPNDRSTSTGTMIPSVIVDYGGRPVGKTVLDALTAKVHLVTWPEKTEVGAIASGLDASEKSRVATVLVTPKMPLQDRWYALTVDPLPAGLRLAKFGAMRAASDGSALVRFRPGSEATVSWVETCHKNSKTRRHVVFSERVSVSDLSTAVTFAAAPGAVAPSCKPVTANEKDVADKPAAATVSSISYECDDAADAAVVVTAGAGIMNAGLGKAMVALTLAADPRVDRPMDSDGVCAISFVE